MEGKMFGIYKLEKLPADTSHHKRTTRALSWLKKSEGPQGAPGPPGSHPEPLPSTLLATGGWQMALSLGPTLGVPLW